MFGLFSSKKPFNASVNANTAKLEVAAGDNLLNAALSSGVAWPHNCRVGSCGTCRCRLVDGKIKPLNDFGYVLDADELDQGMILACQTRLLSDISVEVALEDNAAALSIAETVSGTISSMTLLTHDILEVRVVLDVDLPPYIAGQYADVKIEAIPEPRSYSFSRAPSLEDKGTVSFFVRHVPGGKMSGWLHDANRVGEKVTVNGPLGNFYLRESSTPALLIAGGSGLAPIKSVLEQYAQNGFSREIVFLFGARTQQDLYCIDEMNRMVALYDKFRFLPVLSDENGNSDWSGSRGLITEYIEEQGIDLPNSQAYLCGPPPMIDSAIEVLNKSGLVDDHIYFDKFLDASNMPDGRR